MEMIYDSKLKKEVNMSWESLFGLLCQIVESGSYLFGSYGVYFMMQKENKSPPKEDVQVSCEPLPNEIQVKSNVDSQNIQTSTTSETITSEQLDELLSDLLNQPIEDK
jgi:hypothetical protein